MDVGRGSPEGIMSDIVMLAVVTLFFAVSLAVVARGASRS
jgi:hypothetical protein